MTLRYRRFPPRLPQPPSALGPSSRLCGLSRTRLQERLAGRRLERNDRLVWHTIDPDGRPVDMELRGWQHIVEAHEQLGVGPETILAAVASPDRRTRGARGMKNGSTARTRDRVAGSRSSYTMRATAGLIVTAFPRRSFP
jgi:hypothetical protein